MRGQIFRVAEAAREEAASNRIGKQELVQLVYVESLPLSYGTFELVETGKHSGLVVGKELGDT